jgi:hypothetical protein
MIFTEKPIFTEFNQGFYSFTAVKALIFYAHKFTNFTAIKMGKSVKIRKTTIPS